MKHTQNSYTYKCTLVFYIKIITWKIQTKDIQTNLSIKSHGSLISVTPNK